MSQYQAYPPRYVGPRWATRLLRHFCAPHRVEEMEGDLDELFQQRVERVGLRKARWRYWRDVLSLMRPSLMKRQPSLYPNPIHTDMLRNYFKIAVRSLLKQKLYSGINIFGLALGMACALLIGLWVRDELSYDRFLPDAENVCYVRVNFLNPATGQVAGTNPITPGPLQEAIAEDVPQVAVTKINYEICFLLIVSLL